MTTGAAGPHSSMQPRDGFRELKIFLVATEESGDRLGAALMKALRNRSPVPVSFSGVGGHEMTAAGLTSLFPVGDFSIIGFAAIPRRLPGIIRHTVHLVRAVLARSPHVMVVIDSPAFTLPVARFVHWFNRSIPIVDYVSPSVWAWRAGRARSMSGYIDHVLALLPFEPEVHRKLGGPPCSYVGHPLIEDASKLRPSSAEAQRRRESPPVVLAMPGSRSSEVVRLGRVFGETLALVAERVGPIEVVVPTVPHLLAQVTQAVAEWPTKDWTIKPRVVVEQTDKLAALRMARAALAKSGTTTLELAVAGVPMVAAYKVSAFEAFVIRRLVRVSSYILANLVIGQNVVPELVQEDCTPDRLADTLVPLLGDTPQRQRQVDAFATLDSVMQIGSSAPAARAADIVLGSIRVLAGSVTTS